jgi:hypothetical protein
MTEAEWLACSDPKVMWEYCDRRATQRKKMLLRVAFCRHALTKPDQIEEYEFELSVGEGWADGQLGGDVCARVHFRLSSDADEAGTPYATFNDPPNPRMSMQNAIIAALAPGDRATEATLAHAQQVIEDSKAAGKTSAPHLFATFIRDIFGNPFRPVAFAREWRTGTAVSLAKQMYESRDFGAMPILADALQDAGCDRADVLDHCRGPGAHVRGCWVVDLVLGKE